MIITKCLKCGAIYKIYTKHAIKRCPNCGSLDIDKTTENKTDKSKINTP